MADSEFHHIAILQVGDALVWIVVLTATRVRSRHERAVGFYREARLEDDTPVLQLLDTLDGLSAITRKTDTARVLAADRAVLEAADSSNGRRDLETSAIRHRRRGRLNPASANANGDAFASLEASPFARQRPVLLDRLVVAPARHDNEFGRVRRQQTLTPSDDGK